MTKLTGESHSRLWQQSKMMRNFEPGFYGRDLLTSVKSNLFGFSLATTPENTLKLWQGVNAIESEDAKEMIFLIQSAWKTKLPLLLMILPVLVGFIPRVAFAEDAVNIPNVLWEQGIIEEQGKNDLMISSWDENGSPNLPYKAYDGDMDTKWCTQSEDVSWLKIDFGEPRLVIKFVVYMAGNCQRDKGEWQYNLADFQIQFSMTGKENSWVDEVIVKDNPPDAEHGILTFEIKPKPERWVRLYITNQGADKHARVPEFQVWGALTATVSSNGKLATTWGSIKKPF